ncbi:MAG: peptidoglycan-binding protein [Deltaproteobacteria bacterium]|nr:peptidoglycan-binding protein [Deltaproteobacteria bacterium]
MSGTAAATSGISTPHPAAGEAQRPPTRGECSESVRTLQQALLAHGASLPRFGADGAFGRETEAALRWFQRGRGLPASGKLDAATRAALAAPVRLPPGDAPRPAAAPARPATPPTASARTADVVEMAKDGLLHAVVGVGFDEQGADLDAAARARGGLLARGFVPLRVSGLDDAQVAALGIPPGTLDPRSTYYTRELLLGGRTVRALVQFVDRDSEAPREEFLHGLRNAELVLYAGHARYGSGPDFDALERNDGNVVFGTAYDPAMRARLRGEPNALQRERLSPGYQLMLFAGCRTRDYLDELRALPRGKDPGNLDLLLSDDLLYWSDMPETVLATLDAVVAGQDVEALRGRLARLNRGATFTADGFGDNPVPRS